jgi:hypothetical protein
VGQAHNHHRHQLIERALVERLKMMEIARWTLSSSIARKGEGDEIQKEYLFLKHLATLISIARWTLSSCIARKVEGVRYMKNTII